MTDSSNLSETDRINLESEVTSPELHIIDASNLKEFLKSTLNNENPNIADLNLDRKDGILYTDASEPRLTYENGAVPCVILVAYDKKGNCAIIHEPMTTNVATTGRISEISEQMLHRLDSTAVTFGPDRRLLITGVNVQNDLRRETLTQVKSMLPSYADRTDEIFSNNDGVIKHQEGMFGVTTEVYDGVCHIPPQLSKDGKTHVVVVKRNKNENPITISDIFPKTTQKQGFGISYD